MWSVTNETPFAADGSWGRDRDGVHEWIVAIKATFDIDAHGVPSIAEEQIPPSLAPEFWSEDEPSSLRYPADLVGTKPTTDIILNGTAYAPNGRAATAFPISMRVGPVEKSLRVVGDRVWTRSSLGSGASDPTPVLTVPVLYERAYGGFDQTSPDPGQQRMDPRNPVGRGVVAQQSRRIGQPMPNFEYLNGTLAKAGPAGFGAVAGHWSPRRELMGTYDQQWKDTRFPLLPTDWDPRSRQCAPLDQRPPAPLRGGEPVALVHLTPNGVLRFELPRVDLRLETFFGRRGRTHAATLSTIILEPDHPRVLMTWSSTLPCPTDIDDLDETVVTVEGETW